MTSVDTVVRQNDTVDSLRGKLLVASPAITDPNFRRVVVLIAEHGADGAMGIVLDRVSEATVGEVVGGLSWLAGDDAEVYVGGPVATTSSTRGNSRTERAWEFTGCERCGIDYRSAALQLGDVRA